MPGNYRLDVIPIQLRAFEFHKDDPRHKVVRTEGELWRAVQWLEQHPEVAFDTETSGLQWHKHAEICGASFAAWDVGGIPQSFYFPCRHQTGEQQLHPRLVMDAVRRITENQRICKLMWNEKFERHMLKREGVVILGPHRDAQVEAHLYDENTDVGLDDRANTDLRDPTLMVYSKILNRELARLAKDAGVGITEFKRQTGFARGSVGLVGVYGCYDAETTLRLGGFYDQHGVRKYFADLYQTELDMAEVLFEMEENGLPIDAERLRSVAAYLADLQARMIGPIRTALGDTEFDPANDGQLRTLLVRRLGLEGELWKRTKSGLEWSVDAEVIGFFAKKHPILKDIQRYRDAEKIRTTYTQSILDEIGNDGLLHGSFDSLGTNTGRMSSSDPNLQNIAGDDDERAKEATGKSLEDGGKDPWSIKAAFVNRGPEWIRLYIDYSQVELRVLARYCQDPVLLDTFWRDEDAHDRTSMEMFGTLEKPKRRVAKVINFGLCLAEGQLVLTQRGEVPIELVQDTDKLWDGIEWVGHDGLVCRGVQEVMEHDGLIATPDHEVYTQGGRRLSLRECASQVSDRQIAVGAIAGMPVGYVAFDRRNQMVSGWQPRSQVAEGACEVLCLPEDALVVPGQCGQREDDELYVSGEVSGFEGGDAWGSLRRYGAALQSRFARFFEALQGSGDSGALCVAGGLHSLGIEDLSACRLLDAGPGPGGQRWPLLAGELPVRNVVGEQSKQAPKRVRVYDLLNAGPRHRFTVSGKIVSNSYGMTEKGFAIQTGISEEQALAYMQVHANRYPGIDTWRRRLWAGARRHAQPHAVSLFGRVRRIPYLNSAEKWQRLRGERQLVATIIQGSAAQIMKRAMVKIWKWERANRTGMKMVSVIHDDLQSDVPKKLARDIVHEMVPLMERHPEMDPVPIKVDCEWSDTDWSEKKEVPEEHVPHVYRAPRAA